MSVRLALVGSKGVSTGVALRQRVQQCLRIFQVRRIKAFGEPPVDRCQEVMGFLALALLLPETRQAGGGPQLPGFGSLVAGQGQGLVEAGFGLVHLNTRLLQKQGAREPMDLRSCWRQAQRAPHHWCSFGQIVSDEQPRDDLLLDGREQLGARVVLVRTSQNVRRARTGGTRADARGTG